MEIHWQDQPLDTAAALDTEQELVEPKDMVEPVVEPVAVLNGIMLVPQERQVAMGRGCPVVPVAVVHMEPLAAVVVSLGLVNITVDITVLIPEEAAAGAAHPTPDPEAQAAADGVN